MTTQAQPTPTAPSTPAAPGPVPVQIGGESLLERLAPHIRKIAYAAIGLVGVFGVIMLIRGYQAKQDAKATRKVAAVLDVAARDVKGESLAAPDPSDFATAADRAKAVVDEMTKQASPTLQGAFMGTQLSEVGKLDEAIAAYKAAATGGGADAIMAREGLALALEAKASALTDAAAKQQGLEAALAAAKQIQPDEKGFRRDVALYHQGRMHEALGQTAEAKVAFTNAKTLGQDASLKALIDQRLAMLGEK